MLYNKRNGRSTISLKTSVRTRFKNTDFTLGIRESLYSPFYKKSENPFYDSNHRLFPYKSILSLLKSFEWPLDYTFVLDFPKEVNNDWTDEVNGVANDGKNWFIIQKNRIWKFPLDHDLRDTTGVFQTGIPEDLSKKGYNHFGDSSYYNHPKLGELLFVPLEGIAQYVEDGSEFPILGPVPAPKILLYKLSSTGEPVYSASVSLVADEVMTTGEIVTKQLASAPWCAVNPLNGLLYTSNFNASFLYVFEPDYTVGVQFDYWYRGKFKLLNVDGNEMEIQSIQGGSFSKNGHLYLVSDRAYWSKNKDDVANSGIYAFDMTTGRNIKHIPIFYEPTISMPWPIPDIQNQELEGMDIWDLGSEWGQIHVMLNDNEPEHDDVFFKHFKVSSGDEDKI